MAAVMSASAKDLETINSCLLWGIVTVAGLSFGLACVLQAGFIYWKRYPRDRRLNKFVVVYLCLCCVTHCSLVIAEVTETIEALLHHPINPLHPLQGQFLITSASRWLYVPDRFMLWLTAVPVETFFALRAISMYSSKKLYWATIAVCVLGSAMFLSLEIYRVVVMATTGFPFNHNLAIIECAALWANAVFHGVIITLLLRQVLASRAAAEPKARSHHVKGIWSAALLETSAALAILNLGMSISASFLTLTRVFPPRILFFGAYTPAGAFCVIFTLNSRRAVAEKVDKRVRLADVRGTRDDPSTWKGDVSLVHEDRLIVTPRRASRCVTNGPSGGGVVVTGIDGSILEKPEEVDFDRGGGGVHPDDLFNPDEIELDESALRSVKPASMLPSPRVTDHTVWDPASSLSPDCQEKNGSFV